MKPQSIDKWPALPLEAWRDTCETVHRWAQIVGKIQLESTPLINHYWNVGLQVTPRGLATSTMTLSDGRWFDVALDFFADLMRIQVSDGTSATVALAARPVAEFYEDTVVALKTLGIPIRITTMPSEIVDPGEAIPFPKDRMHHSYDKDKVLAFWRIVARATQVLTNFRAGYVCKASPPLFYWGHFDLTLSLFTGREMPAPVLEQFTDKLEREGYSHELFSAGWWPGDSRLPRPTFYASAAPEPPGFSTTKLPGPIRYEPSIHSFCLDYEDMRKARNPDALLRDFYQSTYNAAADLAGWDRKALERGDAS